MFRIVVGISAAALALVGTLGVAVAQTDTVHPNRNDPPPSPPNQTAKDTVPPATDGSLPTRGGKQEPSSKIEGTDASTAILSNGVLTVPGAQRDLETAPAKFSDRTNAADQLPIAAYALRHLTAEQRDHLYRALQKPMALSGETWAEDFAVVGAEIPTAVSLNGLEPLPAELVSKMRDPWCLCVPGPKSFSSIPFSTRCSRCLGEPARRLAPCLNRRTSLEWLGVPAGQHRSGAELSYSRTGIDESKANCFAAGSGLSAFITERNRGIAVICQR
jgi:hypothetical protein